MFVCILAYGDMLTHKFMLDERVLYVNPDSPIYTHYQHWIDFFKKPLDQHYAPLNFLLNKSLFSLFHRPLPLYLINFGLFYLNCFLWFLFVYLVSRDFSVAALTSVFFCIHPMTADIPQHIIFNIILIQNLLMELGLVFLYLYYRHKDMRYYALGLLIFFISMFCQEFALLFPLYALAFFSF